MPILAKWELSPRMRSQNSLCSSSQLTENPALWENKSLVPMGYSVPSLPAKNISLCANQNISYYRSAHCTKATLTRNSNHLGETIKGYWENHVLADITYSCTSSKSLFVSLTILMLSILLKHKRQTTLLIYSNTGSISHVTKYCKKQNPITLFT